MSPPLMLPGLDASRRRDPPPSCTMLFQDTFSCSYTTPYHRIANAANAFDLDFHDIPVMQKERGSAFEPHSRWRPCRDDIAWLQGHEGTEESVSRGHR